MSDLISTQHDFAAALRDAGQSTQALRWLAGDESAAARRLGIYRGNVSASIAKALAAAYPVIRQVVGEEFFGGLAHAYQHHHPSTSGDLFEFGAGLAVYLEGFPHALALPYLPDLARLEWAAHRAYAAQDAEPPDLVALAAVPAESQGSLCFTLAAGTAIVASAHPIVRIWRIHQPDHAEAFSVDWSVAECALVAREGFQVVVSSLDAGAAAFIGQLLDAATLAQATDAALAVDPGFDLARALARAIETNLICGFTRGEDSP